MEFSAGRHNVTIVVLFMGDGVKNIFEKKGAQGPLIFTERQLEVTNQDGLPVFIETETSIAR